MTNPSSGTDRPVVDCCVHVGLRNPLEMLDHIDRGWRDYLVDHLTPEWQGYLAGRSGPPATPVRVPFVTPATGYESPLGDKLLEADRYEIIDYMNRSGTTHAVLCPETAMLTPSLPNARLSAALARASNDWLIDRWLRDSDPRLYGLAVVPNQIAEAAVDELTRIAKEPMIVGVLMAANGLSKPLGHPAYQPIYAAAADLGLPVVMHAGSERVLDTLAYPTGAGMPATVTEYRAMRDQAQATYVVDLITQGVFERYPSLRVLIMGAGVTWIAPVLWRFDTDAKGLRRDVPWLKELPSEYFRKYFRVGTAPIESAPSADQLARYLGAYKRIEDVLCFASGYPDIDSLDPGSLGARLPEAWLDKVMADNALALFQRLGESATLRPASAKPVS